MTSGGGEGHILPFCRASGTMMGAGRRHGHHSAQHPRRLPVSALLPAATTPPLQVHPKGPPPRPHRPPGLRVQYGARGGHQAVEELEALLLAGEQAAPHAGKPDLARLIAGSRGGGGRAHAIVKMVP